MDFQIKKTLSLIKKSYDQPIIFHILHNHLSFLLKKVNPAFEMVDDWSKILIMSAHSIKLAFQGIEIKIQRFLNENKTVTTKEQKLKLMCICYYLINKPCNQINHILIFELINNYLGNVSNYFDGLIIKILTNLNLARLFDQEINQKVKFEYIEKMLEICGNKNLSNNCKLKLLPCFINSNIIPFDLNFLEIENNYFGYKSLELVCLYAKYTVNTTYIKDILPSNPFFITELGNFMNLEFNFTYKSKYDLKQCVVEDLTVYNQIRDAYEKSSDKQKFISKILDFITSLK